MYDKIDVDCTRGGPFVQPLEPAINPKHCVLSLNLTAHNPAYKVPTVQCIYIYDQRNYQQLIFKHLILIVSNVTKCPNSYSEVRICFKYNPRLMGTESTSWATWPILPT